MGEAPTIYTALAAAQAEMGKAVKETKNDAFKGRMYADLSNVIDACRPALNKHGIAVLQPLHDEDGKFYVKTILAHTSGAILECRVPLIIGKNDMQGYGSAVTYARRYGLMAMAGIAPEDDDGNAAVESVEKPRPAEQPRPAEFDPAPHVDAITSAPTGKALLGVIPGAHADHPAISAAIVTRVAALIETVPTVQALDAMSKAFAPIWSHVEKAAADRRAALEKPANADLGADEIPY
jgi:hypothetical protein